MTQVENLLQRKIRTLRTDGGTEFQPIARQYPHITHQTSCPYTPQQNGVAERKHRHVVETSLAIMQHASLPTRLWDDVFATAVYLINRLPPSHASTSPFQLLFNKQPDYHDFRVVGCLCFPYLRPYTHHKLEQRSKPCVFLGYAGNQKGYRCYDMELNKIFISRHVVFEETMFPFRDTTTNVQSSESELQFSLWLSTNPLESLAANSSCTMTSPTGSPEHTNDGTNSPTASETHTTTAVPNTTDDVPVLPSHHMITRNKDGTRKPKLFPDFVAYVAQKDYEPRNYNQAKEYPHWREAMTKEINALAVNKTWTLVPPSPEQHVVDCKWIFKVKTKADGSLERHKARLVARGFTQEEGIDYFDTFSPVVRPTTIRLILSIAVSKQWAIRQLDVQNAFLHGELQENVFMTQPPGFVDQQHPDYVCHLKKAIYGLKQSPRAWFHTLSSALLQLGFIGSKHDPSLFVLHVMGHTVVMLIYVDDIIITSSSNDLLHKMIVSLQEKFALKDLGKLHYFLGVAVSSTGDGLFLSQTKYVQDIIHKANMQAAKPLPSPIAVNTVLSKDDGDPFDDPHLYRIIVGALQYATITRPDIAYAVNKVSQFMHSPTVCHWATVKRILRYLIGTDTHGIHIKASSLFQLNAYSDADWAGCPDDRRSTSGFCIFFGNNIISWSSKKQPTVSKSSTEAEYRSLAQASAEVIWLQYLLQELHVQLSSPPVLWCDNIGATFLASNPMFHARTKHVEIDYHFVREKVVSKQLSVKFQCSKDQIADCLTKPLTTSRFQLLRDKLTVSTEPSA